MDLGAFPAHSRLPCTIRGYDSAPNGATITSCSAQQRARGRVELSEIGRRETFLLYSVVHLPTRPKWLLLSVESPPFRGTTPLPYFGRGQQSGHRHRHRHLAYVCWRTEPLALSLVPSPFVANGIVHAVETVTVMVGTP
jgi:hypothetical protein